MNLLKPAPFLVASLFATTAAFGNNANGMEKKPCSNKKEAPARVMQSGYNAPAEIQVNRGWDVYSSASFIYWNLSQEGMEVAFNDTLSPSSANFRGSYVSMDFDYQPGFKVGMGADVNFDDWDIYGEYTYLRGSSSKSKTASAIGGLYPTWGHPYVAGTNAFNTASEHWHCNFDFADLEIGRSYYVGTALTFRPSLGVRGAWIRQHAHVQYTNNNISSATPAPSILGLEDIYQRSRSWGVGPRIGIDGNWMVTKEFRLFGDVSGDLLYTKYKTQSKTNFLPYVSNSTTTPTYTISVPVFFISKTKPSYVRAHVDLEAGAGWGTYFADQKWHIDFEASYGFQVFFDQNMFRHYEDHSAVAQSKSPNGNLYVHGLTASARLDY